MHDLVVKLYSGTWSGSVREAAELVSPDDAPRIVQDLTLCRGWRERVAAARIASAFELHELVAPLVRTFAHGPEAYTAAAFAKLTCSLGPHEGQVLLTELREACPTTAYGQHLLKVIEREGSSETEA